MCVTIHHWCLPTTNQQLSSSSNPDPLANVQEIYSLMAGTGTYLYSPQVNVSNQNFQTPAVEVNLPENKYKSPYPYIRYDNHQTRSNIPLNTPTSNFSMGREVDTFPNQHYSQLQTPHDLKTNAGLCVGMEFTNSISRPAHPLPDGDQEKKVEEDIFRRDKVQQFMELSVRWGQFMDSIPEEQRSILFRDVKKYFTA
ncbi:hypothetical protein BFJ67_g16339 [Fusarium oxysporum f. sp. cepae]|nr:hypothetical protein BFJ67_g16339 [Fusarium oxysporum f. sp. cepae]